MNEGYTMFQFVNDGKGKWQSWECHASIPYDGADAFYATSYGETEAEARSNMIDLINKAMCAMNAASETLQSNAGLSCRPPKEQQE